MQKVTAGLMILAISLLMTPEVFSHCEVPCGIYGDGMRFDMIAEHIVTIEKSMKQIVQLSKETDKNYNQIVRWTHNKEVHANKLQEIVHQYFMTQRVKPVDAKDTEGHKKYVEKVTLLHQMLVYAMKAKQTTDLSNVEKLRSLLASFKAAYSTP
jgi:nickel superoxide dismutase